MSGIQHKHLLYKGYILTIIKLPTKNGVGGFVGSIESPNKALATLDCYSDDEDGLDALRRDFHSAVNFIKTKGNGKSEVERK